MTQPIETAIEKVPNAAIDQAFEELFGPLVLAEEELNLLAQEAALDAKRDKLSNEQWLVEKMPEWYIGKKAELNAAREIIKEQAKRMLAQIDAREKVIDWNWAEQFQAQVNTDLRAQGGKKKSIDYLTGRAGWRSTGGKPTLVVEDEAKALAMAELMCPEAVTRKLKTSVLLKYAQANEPLDGTRVEQTGKVESFYPAPLLVERERALLKGESDVPASD